MALICMTCSTLTKKFAVCLVCAHRCHSSHYLVPLGFDILQCECSFISGHSCNSLNALRKPAHLRLSNGFIPQVHLFKNPCVSIKPIDGVTTYISNDFETNTLITQSPLCEINPNLSDSVSESPSLSLELEREMLEDLNFERRYNHP